LATSKVFKFFLFPKDPPPTSGPDLPPPPSLISLWCYEEDEGLGRRPAGVG